jgi:hypothetical protein
VRNIGFINRLNELQSLEAMVAEPQSGATALFIRAPSGVGKSSILLEFFRRQARLKAVRVPMLARLDTDRLDYLNHIVRELDEFAARARSFPRFQQFLSLSRSPQIAAETASRVVGRISAWFPAGAAAVPIAQKVLHTEEYSGQAIMFRDKSLDVAATSSYVAEFMRDPMAALAIENVQYIDDRSLLILLNVIEETHSGYWIFEYTNNADGHAFDTLMSRVRSTGADVRSMEISGLPWDELRREFAIENPTVESILRQYYLESNGNLRNFLDATRLSGPGGNPLLAHGSTSATKQVLARLPSDRAQIVALLAMHDGEVEIGLLKHAWIQIRNRAPFPEKYDFEGEISHLTQENICRCNGSIVKFDHDSVLRTAQEIDEHERMRRIAATAWLHIYREMRRTSDIFVAPAAISSAILFYSFYLGDEAELFSTLRNLTAESLAGLAPKRLLKYVEALYSRIDATGRTDKDRLHEVTKRVIRILYRINAFDVAQRLVGMLQPSSSVTRFYQAAIAVELDKPNDALVQCENILQDLSLGLGDLLIPSARLIKLAALRMTNQIADCEAEYRALQHEQVFKRSPLEPHFLIQAGLALPTDEAVPLVREGVAMFHKMDAPYEANCGRVTLSQCLGDLGRLDEAAAALDAVESSGMEERERYTVWNNRVVLNLYRRHSDDEMLRVLREAILLPDDRFSRLIILINLLLVHTLRYARAEAQEVADHIHKMLLEGIPQEYEIRRSAAFNLRYFYSKFDLKCEADEMMEFAINLPSRINQPLWDFRFGRRESVPEEYKFRIGFEYYPPMFAYWLLDASDRLEH